MVRCDVFVSQSCEVYACVCGVLWCGLVVPGCS